MYAAVAFVSLYHAMAFFALSNPAWLSTILAVTFEVGQAVVLFSILTSRDKSPVMPWVLMTILTAVQVLGNVFSTYKYMLINNIDQIQYFTKSILFFVQNPNPEYNYVVISYITGAILPIVALLMTGMVTRAMRGEKNVEEEKEEPQHEEVEKEEMPDMVEDPVQEEVQGGVKDALPKFVEEEKEEPQHEEVVTLPQHEEVEPKERRKIIYD